MKVEKIEAKRVQLYDGFYVEITPMEDDKRPNENYCDFWLYKRGWGLATYIIGCDFKDEEEMLWIVENYAIPAIPHFREEYEEIEELCSQ